MKDIALSTSAVPTYFMPVKIDGETYNGYTFVDGGVFANNPSLCAYFEVRKRYSKLFNNYLIVSLGTGDTTPKITYEDAKKWGLFSWGERIVEIVLNGMNNMVDYYAHSLLDESKYFRFQPMLASERSKANTDITDTSNKNLKALKDLSKDLINKKSKEIDLLCSQIS